MRALARLLALAPVGAIIATGILAAEAPAADTATTLANASMETVVSGAPSCWKRSGFGTSSFSWTTTSVAHSGTRAQRLNITGYTSGDRKLVTVQDDGICAPVVIPGRKYKVGGWYASNGSPRLAVYYRTTSGAWLYWTKSPNLPASTVYRAAEFTTPALPADATNISFGFSLGEVGHLLVDDMGLAAVSTAAPFQATGNVLFQQKFERSDGLITNEYAYWNPDDTTAMRSPDWEMTSGSLFASGGAAYSGPPDRIGPDATSAKATDSAVFRLNTSRYDFGNTSVTLALRVRRLSSTSATPAVDWDGVHIFLRYQSQYHLYYASVNRRDGRVVIKKKCPGGPSNGGTYYVIGQEIASQPIPFGVWQRVGASVINLSDGSVLIALSRDGKTLTTARDTGVGCAPITTSGAVGLRGDNAELDFDDFTVRVLR
jgi:hypothetical protein